MTYPQEWALQEKISAAVRDCAKNYEVHEVSRRVDSLEHSLREARAEASGLRDELQELRASLATAQDAIISLQQMALSSAGSET